MGPRPLLTPRLSLFCPLPSPKSYHVPGRLALWNRMPQGQPCERPHPSPFDHPCPDVVVRPRNKEEMEAREKLQIQFRRDWRFHVYISPPRGQAAVWELPAAAGGVQWAEAGPGGGPWAASVEKGAASREPGRVGEGCARQVQPLLPVSCGASAVSWVLPPVGRLPAPGLWPFLPFPTRGASRPSLVSWLSPDSPIVEEKTLTRTLHKDWCYNGAKPLATC